MSIDEPVAPNEAILQRYFDGTLEPAEAAAFEDRLAKDPELAAQAASYASLFAALELRHLTDRPDFALSVVERWVESVDPRAAIRFFVGLDAVLGVLLVGLLGLKGPAGLVASWLIGLKDVALAAHSVVAGPEQGVVLVLAALGVAVAAVVGVGLALGRSFIGTGSAA